MPSSDLHLLSFDVPHPPDYGGVVDVFYRIKALHACGVRVHLHCFAYGRRPANELYQYCQTVRYYPRHTNLRSVWQPHIVASRRHHQLLQHLIAEPYPILFEGVHSTAWLSHPALRQRTKIVRLHNIEADYYRHLAQNEHRLTRSTYYTAEAWKLHRYEPTLQHAQHLLAISPNDYTYFAERFGTQKVHYLPAFHAQEAVVSLLGRGDFALYHGNLSVSENYRAALFLATEVFNDLDIPLIIAGKNPDLRWFDALNQYNNIELCVNPSEMELFDLMQDAHLHVLPTFQPTGIKLKLLHALYTGRFCLANAAMVQHTGLESICHIADTAAEFKHMVQQLFTQSFSPAAIAQRKTLLDTHFNNQHNAQKIIALL